jgi:uncharacterized protein YyaL (SSP411 family)
MYEGPLCGCAAVQQGPKSEKQVHRIRCTVLRTGKSAGEVRVVLAESRQLLHERRAQRPRPHLDDKVLQQ